MIVRSKSEDAEENRRERQGEVEGDEDVTAAVDVAEGQKEVVLAVV